MKSLMVEPLKPDSLRVEDIGEPSLPDGHVLVRALALGICGTDRDIIAGRYGSPPPRHKRLVIGHESLGEVISAPAGPGPAVGDLVVPFVRMPDPTPCDCCAAGEWDRCRNDGFTEHGIKSLDGFGRERYSIPADHLLVIDRTLGVRGILLEPTSVVAKAWMMIDRIGQAGCWQPRKVLVTGAGPVGLLAALIGAQRRLDIHLLDHAVHGPRPALARSLGATYHGASIDDLPADFDIIVECTGAPSIVLEAARHLAPDGVACLLGVSGASRDLSIDAAMLNDSIVLGNRVVFGSVNANRSHYEMAHTALRAADPAWLDRMITRRVPFERWEEAFRKEEHDVKTIITFDDSLA